MNALVVFDTKFGNTERVARTIAAALGERFTTDVRPIAETQVIPVDLALLVVGGPTHAHGVDPVLKSFLGGVPAATIRGVAAAAFDTRYHVPVLISGSAARAIAKRLHRKGARLVARPESFFVEHGEGPLADGELARAEAWARGLAENLVRAA